MPPKSSLGLLRLVRGCGCCRQRHRSRPIVNVVVAVAAVGIVESLPATFVQGDKRSTIIVTPFIFIQRAGGAFVVAITDSSSSGNGVLAAIPPPRPLVFLFVSVFFLPRCGRRGRRRHDRLRRRRPRRVRVRKGRHLLPLPNPSSAEKGGFVIN